MAEIDLPLNLEMAATEEMLAIALAPPPARRLHRPRKARGAHHRGRARRRRAAQSPRLLSSTGCATPASASACSSSPIRRQIEAAIRLGAPVVEFHTGRYAHLDGDERAGELKRIADAAALAAKNGIEPHAGHGLTFDNVAPIAAIPQLAELNIGHFLVGEAIFTGLEASVGDARLMDAR